MRPQPLSALRDGECAAVRHLDGDEAMVRRLRDLGMIEGTTVSCVFHAPSGDPAAYLIRGALIAIRGQDAENIAVERSAAL